MALSVEKWKKYRSRFAWVFAISFVVFVISLAYESSSPQKSPHVIAPAKPRPFGYPAKPPPHSIPMKPPGGSLRSQNLAMLISVASLLTSGTTLVGFFITTAIAWRKERREQQQGNLELEIKRLELERLRIEVERKKPDSSSSA
jgi:hypothetical protein